MVAAAKGSVAIVVIAAALPLVVAVLLMAGGAAERDVAECSLEARKLFPVLPEPPNKRAREDYVSSAWRAKAGTGWASKKKAAISATATLIRIVSSRTGSARLKHGGGGWCRCSHRPVSD